MADIKKCPFCGWGKTRIIYRYVGTRIRYIEDYRLTTEAKRCYVRCNRCYAHGGSVTGQTLSSFCKIRLYKNDYWHGANELFVDDLDSPQEEPAKPELPTWVMTKEELKEEAIALWNMRLDDGRA